MKKAIIFISLFFIQLVILNAQIEYTFNENVFRALVIEESADNLTLLNDKLEKFSLKRSEISKIKKIKCAITRMSVASAYKEQNYGRVDSISGKFIYFKDDNGNFYRFKPSFIEIIRFIDENTDKFYSVGFVAGYPTLINLAFSVESFYYSNLFGIAIQLGMYDNSEMWVPTINGFIYYKLINKKSLNSNAGLCISFPLNPYTKNKNDDNIYNAYVGVKCDINIHGLYTGVGLGINSESSLIPIFNVGCILYF